MLLWNRLGVFALGKSPVLALPGAVRALEQIQKMGLYLEILDGELKGSRHPIYKGLAIGRRDADITIKDPRISGRHVVVETGPDGGFILIDQGSSNGIKVGEERVRQLPITQGVIFTLGRTSFKITQEGAASTEPDALIEVQTEDSSWQERVKELLGQASQSEAKRRPVAPFEPVLHLHFRGGLQTGTTWILGYGPRDIGVASIDLPIEEAGAPGLCFRLIPQSSGVLFQNFGGSAVYLNGQTVERDLIRDGDRIEIGATRIEVRFGAES